MHIPKNGKVLVLVEGKLTFALSDRSKKRKKSIPTLNPARVNNKYSFQQMDEKHNAEGAGSKDEHCGLPRHLILNFDHTHILKPNFHLVKTLEKNQNISSSDRFPLKLIGEYKTYS